MTVFKCLRRELILPYIEGGRSVSVLEPLLRDCYEVSEDNLRLLIADFKKTLLPQFNIRWNKASRRKELFLKVNNDWLGQEFLVTLSSTTDVTASTSTGKRGRPCVSYENSSESSKKRKNSTLLTEYGFEHIYGAYIQGLRSMGESNEAKVVEALRSADADKKKSMLKMMDDSNKNQMMTDEEALSVFIELDLTKAQYLYLRNIMRERNCFLLPPYYKIQDSKKKCYPPVSTMEITNICAKMLSLQELLDHTATRILMIDSVHKSELKQLVLYTKWGCDGSSGQSEYKQKLPEESELVSDSNLFITSLVPIRLIDEATGSVIWQNPVPSSVRFCRPISMEFSKETPEKIKGVVNDIQSQIDSLSPSLIVREGNELQVRHELFLTMLDGKVSQVLTNTRSCSTCTICGATPRLMNNLQDVTARPTNKDSFRYGLSTLHAWIRCMEMVLHISYNLSFQKWSATSDEDRLMKREKKRMVQKRFRDELGLIIDKPRQVSGNTNDGNTARRFFYNAACSAEITGVDEVLINRLYVILQALSSGIMIDAQKFGEYTLETAKIYLSKYDWYYMPSSVHKILIHGESIINHFAVLPIGQLSEDAQEARNKDYKKFRLHHARKCSRSATNEDVFHTLLYTSDPYISSLRKSYVRNVKNFDEETLQLLNANQLTTDFEIDT